MGLQDQLLNAAVSQLFKHYDKDESGGLDPAELNNAVRFVLEKLKFEFVVSESMIEKAISGVDKDHNGEVSK